MNIYYKDRFPSETIRLSTDFFLKKNILITEEWHENISGLYSVTISIDGTGFSSNGKGITKELALASAHGELQERLLNNAFFRINSDVLFKCNKDSACNNQLICNYKNSEIDIKKINDAISSDSLKYIEIFKDSDGNELVMPCEMTDLCFGTNGMCAGNSEDEAITQGLSEILERFICKKIIDGTVKPRIVEITNEKEVNHINKIVGLLKKKNIDVYFYDLSGDYDIPAIGSLFVNKKDCCYFFKIGVHPNIVVALERTLTEFAQGKTLNDISKLVSFNLLIHVSPKDDVLMRYFIDGNSAFPITPFINCKKINLQKNIS